MDMAFSSATRGLRARPPAEAPLHNASSSPKLPTLELFARRARPAVAPHSLGGSAPRSLGGFSVEAAARARACACCASLRLTAQGGPSQWCAKGRRF